MYICKNLKVKESTMAMSKFESKKGTVRQFSSSVSSLEGKVFDKLVPPLADLGVEKLRMNGSKDRLDCLRQENLEKKPTQSHKHDGKQMS